MRASASRVVRPVGGDGVSDDDGQRAGIEVIGVDGKELVGSDESDGNEGNLGLDGHVGGS